MSFTRRFSKIIVTISFCPSLFYHNNADLSIFVSVFYKFHLFGVNPRHNTEIDRYNEIAIGVAKREEVSENFECPICGLGKDAFEEA